MRTETRGTNVTSDDGSASSCDTATATCSSASRPWARYICFALIAASGLIGDLWSKHAVFQWLQPHHQHEVWSGSFLGIPVDFQFATTFNLGALWGMGQGQTWLFASLSVLAVFVLVYFLYTGQAVESWWLTISSGLLLAGTLGNLYDRLGLHGHLDLNGRPIYGVRDFLDFVFFNGGFHWATFNLADSYLVTGAILLVLQSFTQPVAAPATSLSATQSCP
ncbi:signal peptidase II [Schlesneria sp.]|uniref:signal peptidase II n=1 Tax=Schlesneria sp. TaxID=2762018 RepID=UPI002F149000